MGTATLVLVYIFARQLTGKVWIALLVTAILAINPWELWYSRNIRFYQVLQCLTILSLWSFFKGFVEKSGKYYQYLFFIALTLTLITQEISLTLLPVFLIGFLYFYRSFSLLQDLHIILGCVITLAIFIYDIGFAAIRLLTPLVAISASTDGYLKLHFSDITILTSNLFLGPDRLQTIYTDFFLIGLFYFINKNDSKLCFLFSSIFIQVLIVTILCYQSDERYVYGIYPLFILLSIYSAISVIEACSSKLHSILDNFIPIRAISLAIVFIVFLTNMQPIKVLAGYNEAITRRNMFIFEYINRHKQLSDVVISPLPSLAVIKLGKLDYFLMGNRYFDAIYWHEGKLIDRWAGATVVSSLDQLNSVLQKSQRVWIHLEDSREDRFSPETWAYIETLGKPAIDSFGTRLRVWQPGDGLPKSIPNQAKDLGAY